MSLEKKVCNICERDDQRCYCNLKTIWEVNQRWKRECNLSECSECNSKPFIPPCNCYRDQMLKSSLHLASEFDDDDDYEEEPKRKSAYGGELYNEFERSSEECACGENPCACSSRDN